MTLQNLSGRFRNAFVGIATRRAVYDYLRFVLLIMFILLAIAWTIDLAENFGAIRREAVERGLPVYQILLPYLTYRSADMLTRMLPMASFFGVFLAEIARRARLETVIFQTAGASPFRMMTSVLIFGLIVGMLQQQLESRWRPAAVAAQVDLGLGGYANRFARVWLDKPAWFLAGDTAIRAQVFRDAAPAMRDVLIFTGLRAPRLQTIYAAKRAFPTREPFMWRLQGVEKWYTAAGDKNSVAMPDMTLRLELIPEQLTYYTVPGFYLPTDPLRRLQQISTDPQTATGANVAVWRRRTAWILPGALALLAVSLSRSGYSGRQPNVPRLVALAVFGYLSVVSIKVLWAVGELGGLAAPVAVLGSVAFILAVCVLLIWRQL